MEAATANVQSCRSWSQTYGYDAAKRLSTVGGTAGTHTYTYRGAGTLWTNLALPNSSRITNAYSSIGALTNTTLRTSGGTVTNRHSYVYNLAHQRTRQTRTDGSYVNYTYDHIGQLRTAVGTGGQSTENLVAQERTSANTPTVSYARGQDLSGTFEGAGGIGGLLARSDQYSGGTWGRHVFYHADGNGNVTALIDSAQTVVAAYRYNPYGQLLGSSGSLAGVNTLRFSSKPWFQSEGLYYYGYRFYDPNLQRWINRDPIHEEGGVNLYGFVSNDSVNLIDPTGEIAFVPILIGIGIGMAIDWAYDEFAADHVNDFINDNFDCDTQANLRTAGSIIDAARSVRNPVRLGIKNGSEAFNTIKDFRRWFHKEWKRDQKVPGGKGKRNPNMDLDEAYEQWQAEGRPKVK
jgi:RHS repeat-associated protein